MQHQLASILDAFTAADCILVGMGHEPDLKPSVTARMKQFNSAFDTCAWFISPVMQTSNRGGYVECFLCRRGSGFQAMLSLRSVGLGQCLWQSTLSRGSGSAACRRAQTPWRRGEHR